MTTHTDLDPAAPWVELVGDGRRLGRRRPASCCTDMLASWC